jgi:hypothetical protein
VATQRHPNPREGSLLIPGRIIDIPEHAGIKSNPEPAFAQHGKVAKRSDGIRFLLDKLTLEKVQNRDKEFARRKAKPSNKMRFKAGNERIVYYWKLLIGDKGFYPARQPDGRMISNMICLSHRGFLPVVR